MILDHLLRFFGVAEELLLLGWLDSWFESEQVGEVAARRPIHIQHLETSEEQVVLLQSKMSIIWNRFHLQARGTGGGAGLPPGIGGAAPSDGTGQD